MRFGNVGYSSSASGPHKVYLSCDQEFFDGYLAERGFTYGEVERSAFKLFDTFDQCVANFNVRSLTFHAEKSGKAFRRCNKSEAAKRNVKAEAEIRF